MINRQEEVIKALRSLTGLSVTREFEDKSVVIEAIGFNNHDEQMEIEFKFRLHNKVNNTCYKTSETKSLITHGYINKYLNYKNKGYPIRLDFLEDDLTALLYYFMHVKLYYLGLSK